MNNNGDNIKNENNEIIESSAEFELRRLFKPDLVGNFRDADDENDADGENNAYDAQDLNRPEEDEGGDGPENPALSGNGTAGGTAEKKTVRRRSAKRGVNAVVRNILLTALCILVGLAAALQYKTVIARAASNPDAEQRITELLGTINTLHSELGSLETERNELQTRLNLVEQSSQDEQIAALREELNSVRTFAGLTTVKGRGIHIQINFDERTNVNIIQSRLLMLINELKASGAQAVSINGIRILAMTELRVVDDRYIAVNARQLVAPYDIYAIGDAGNLHSGITMGGSGIVYQLREMTGTECSWETQENIVINGASDDEIKTDALTVFQ